MADPIPLGNPPRPCQITGLAYATSGNVTIDVQYNNIQVFAGPVPTTIVAELPGPPPDGDKAGIVGTFESDTTVNGLVPLTIINTGGGIFYINDVLMAQCYYWTNPDDGVEWLITPGVPHFISPNINTVEYDGKENPAINGVSIADLRPPEQVAAHTSPDGGIGEWMYRIAPGEVFTCDFLVDLNVLVVPEPMAPAP